MTDTTAPTLSEPVIVADDLSLVYPARSGRPEVRAVDGVSVTLHEGEVLAVLGASGSGKSTLALGLSGRAYGRRPPEGMPTLAGGELTVVGERIKTISQRRRDRLTGTVGYLSQRDGDELNPDLTVGEAVAEPLYERDRRFDRTEAGRLVSVLIDAVHLPLGTMLKQTWELSAGQRQRVALARSLVLEPRVLIADEPARGVDVLVRRSVLELLSTLHGNRRFSAVVVTSSVDEARAVADRMVVLREGRVVGFGEIDDVLESAVDPYVKALSQASPLDIVPDSDRTPKKHKP
ncbi:ATP-binding cassette domain-containing protein [Frondihabitans australicus]|uniref:ABC-type dipeptide/oligopeptide/nickel transport system ATPase component n=1 Tax=Frondihabitans australicus TaxID=386892 RepID=A0A495ID40_9MICO|nr:ATP-binding cassette domain-containing protein [Frondihabitans australicus]RKR73923.1 ABC-type dipeptide/oligopeptide/nickel transport system ATPase component [Frondihabitans australicus]